MKYLLLVSHATFAEGIHGALQMLLGSRENIIACGMSEDESPDDFCARLSDALGCVTDADEAVVLADIAGGSPIRCAVRVLGERGLGADHTIAIGGANLPMAISAVMGLEEGFDLATLQDALLADGAQAVRRL